MDWTERRTPFEAYAKALKKRVRLVIWRMPGGKCKLFFSTKLSMTGEEVLKTYRTRFQIEFCYRDSKFFPLNVIFFIYN